MNPALAYAMRQHRRATTRHWDSTPAGPQPGAVAGSFVMLDFPATKGGRTAPEPSVVYSESLTGALYLDKPDELAAYERVWRGLDALALGEAESKDMIKQIAGEMRHD